MGARCLAAILILAILGCGSSRPEVYMATTNGQAVIGKLAWEVTEPLTGQTLSSGDREIFLQEVQIETLSADGRTIMTKKIPLGGHFYMAMAEAPSKDRSEKMAGFGLTAGRDDERAFSWEWFVPDSETHAVKLQETGELVITTAQVGSKWEVVRTEFLTDTSLRVMRMTEGAAPFQATWRIAIRKGSSITWPSLVNGVVVAN